MVRGGDCNVVSRIAYQSGEEAMDMGGKERVTLLRAFGDESASRSATSR